MMSSMPVMRTPMMALMLAMAAGLSLAQAGERQPCQVSKVADGDTLTCFTPLGQKLRVRFAAIDTPEINQAHGKAAGARLEGLVLYKNVDLRILNTDRYGRKVADVYLGDVWLNLLMVQEGHAWAYRQYRPAKAIIDAETTARKASLGLWGRNPVPPWEFRRRR